MVGRLLVRVVQNWAVDFFLKKLRGLRVTVKIRVLVNLDSHIFASWRHKATKVDMWIEVRVKNVM